MNSLLVHNLFIVKFYLQTEKQMMVIENTKNNRGMIF